ncbi:lipoyl(octanoyl) transferase LipB [Gammaproteobacteria bacterium]|nr:lipoyl(octanoyl) transferase LipB [Gammaproteobacteria bacterium]MDA7856972.1 lipoyl(octanoyl) transferase LipB [Gammaproteobacteria bacterium]MDA8999143.1 lipoyl(octanoyl) transferase LipB [Gammaproteobacteria bacterium]MDA9046100.1 lipoyl(octanoyl) transferase LipB [Gammaproteobacteria bacterium]
MSKELIFKSLGVSNYLETLVSMKAQLQAEYFQNEIWLLEHPPVFTLGTAADNQHILDAKDIPVIQSDRGGEVTYHGPGQLVIYFMIDIKRNKLGPKSLVKTLQEFTRSLLANYSIESNFIEGAPGVYVDGKKIASIGLRISKGKTYHGISINVDMDLTPFSYINPCGYAGLEVTQIKDFKKDITIKDVERLAIKLLEPIF